MLSVESTWNAASVTVKTVRDFVRCSGSSREAGGGGMSDTISREARHPPIAVMLAAEILCNHVEPGWENSKTIVQAWIAEERAARAAIEAARKGQKP